MAHDILPDDPDLPLLHTRNYEVKSFLKDENTVLIRGAVMDRKPGGLYVPDDDEPLVMHHMIVDLTVAYPQMEIIDAAVVFEAHPHTTCTNIVDHYQKLIGLNIARGFTHHCAHPGDGTGGRADDLVDAGSPGQDDRDLVQRVGDTGGAQAQSRDEPQHLSRVGRGRPEHVAHQRR